MDGMSEARWRSMSMRDRLKWLYPPPAPGPEPRQSLAPLGDAEVDYEHLETVRRRAEAAMQIAAAEREIAEEAAAARAVRTKELRASGLARLIGV